MADPGWMEQANREVLAWAEEYRRWRADLIRRGLFPPVVPTPRLESEVAALKREDAPDA